MKSTSVCVCVCVCVRARKWIHWGCSTAELVLCYIHWYSRWNRVCKLTVSQQGRKFFTGNSQRLCRAHSWSLPWTICLHSTFSHLVSVRSILILYLSLCLGLPRHHNVTFIFSCMCATSTFYLSDVVTENLFYECSHGWIYFQNSIVLNCFEIA
jgi:hypothetical protein